MREAKGLIAAREARHARLRAWQAELVTEARASGSARSLLGRRRTLPELADPRPALQKLGEGLAVTAVVAGSAADVVKLALVRLAKDLQGVARLVAVVGDLVLVEHEPGLAADVAATARRTVAGLADELGLVVPLVARTSGLGGVWA